MSAEARLSGMIQNASEEVFDLGNITRYSVRGISDDIIPDSELAVRSIGFESAAVLGSFAVGGHNRLEQLIVNEDVIENDYDFCLAQRAIDEGFEALMETKPAIEEIPDEYADKVLGLCSYTSPEETATPLVAGVYALKREGDGGFEPCLAYNSLLDEAGWFIRDLVLDKKFENPKIKHSELSKKLANPDASIHANTTVSIVQKAFQTGPAEHFANLK